MVDSSSSELSEELQSLGNRDSVTCNCPDDNRPGSTARRSATKVSACSSPNNMDDFRKLAARRLATLTVRQQQILDRIIAGEPSKNIAMDLGISQRTIDSHRSRIAARTGTNNLASLVRLANCGRCALSTADQARKRDKALEVQFAQEESAALKVDMRELQHRMKNMMMIIQSIAVQSARQASTKDEFFERFSGRLLSYSKAIDLLVANQWCGLEIGELVRSQLAVFGLVDGAQIRIGGPKLNLSPRGAHNIALAIHELATNASKYGSLSVPQGMVVISWSVMKNESGRRFQFLWQEVDGPCVSQPTRYGFGRQILEKLVASALSGESIYRFQQDGISWTLDASSASALV